MKRAKGFYGGRSRLWRIAKGALIKAGVYATRDRQQRKRSFRSLWIIRIHAAVEQHDISYSHFIAGLRAASIQVNRKILADLAINDPAAFSEIVRTAKAALKAEAQGSPKQAAGVQENG
jgi:large subunit ribosomal protein L20